MALLVVGVITLGGLLMMSTIFDWQPPRPQGPSTPPFEAPGISVVPTVPQAALPSGDPTEELEGQMIAVTTPQVATTEESSTPAPELRQYIEVAEGCDPHWGGECLNVRSGPGIEYPSVHKLRSGVVLASGGTAEVDGELWYKIIFDEWVRYPERLTGDLYVSGAYVHSFLDEGPIDATGQEPVPSKRIIVDRSDQKLYAYDGEQLFMEEHISTGLDLTPTPRGTFTVFRKTPSRYMQGPLPGISSDYYDLPGVPWNLYFTEEGGAIHGAYWHENFGQQWSHGCVNLPFDQAQELYLWTPVGTTVTVRD